MLMSVNWEVFAKKKIRYARILTLPTNVIVLRDLLGSLRSALKYWAVTEQFHPTVNIMRSVAFVTLPELLSWDVLTVTVSILNGTHITTQVSTSKLFSLSKTSKVCNDIDECNESRCIYPNSLCINTYGSYDCECKDKSHIKILITFFIFFYISRDLD